MKKTFCFLTERNAILSSSDEQKGSLIMKTRKWIAIVLTVSLLLTLGAAALADNGISGSNNITVSYQVAQNYEIVIPTKSVSVNSATSLTVKARNVLLPEGKELQVSMNSANGFVLKCSADGVISEIPYSVTLSGAAIQNGAKILRVASGTTSGEVTLSAAVTNASAATLAGTHSDTLSFRCEVIDAVAEEQKEDTTVTEGDNDDDTSATQGTEGTGSGSGSTTQTPVFGGDRPAPSNPEPQPEPEVKPNPYQYQTR